MICSSPTKEMEFQGNKDILTDEANICIKIMEDEMNTKSINPVMFLNGEEVTTVSRSERKQRANQEDCESPQRKMRKLDNSNTEQSARSNKRSEVTCECPEGESRSAAVNDNESNADENPDDTRESRAVMESNDDPFMGNDSEDFIIKEQRSGDVNEESAIDVETTDSPRCFFFLLDDDDSSSDDDDDDDWMYYLLLGRSGAMAGVDGEAASALDIKVNRAPYEIGQKDSQDIFGFTSEDYQEIIQSLRVVFSLFLKVFSEDESQSNPLSLLKLSQLLSCALRVNDDEDDGDDGEDEKQRGAASTEAGADDEAASALDINVKRVHYQADADEEEVGDEDDGVGGLSPDDYREILQSLSVFFSVFLKAFSIDECEETSTNTAKVFKLLDCIQKNEDNIGKQIERQRSAASIKRSQAIRAGREAAKRRSRKISMNRQAGRKRAERQRRAARKSRRTSHSRSC